MNIFRSSFRILQTFNTNPDTNLKLLLQRSLAGCESRAAAPVYHMVYGTVRHQRLLDELIFGFSKIKARKITAPTLALLECGFFVLLFADSFPDYAVVNELTRQAQPGARGFVNAMLRNAARQRPVIFKKIAALKDPAVRFSFHPDLKAECLHLGMPAAEVMAYLNREPVFHLHPDPRHLSFAELRAFLNENEISHKPVSGQQYTEISETGPVLNALVKQNRAFLQNSASHFVCQTAAKHARIRVLDCCAGPGTKSLALSGLHPDLKILGSDISLPRLKLARHLLARHSRTEQNWLPFTADAARLPLKKFSHLIMLDAPCSSIGTARKNPDLKIKTGKEKIAASAAMQAKILQGLVRQLRGPQILYTVCSFAAAEGEDNIRRLAEKHTLSVTDLRMEAENQGFRVKSGEFGIYLLPDDSMNNDLFYLALFTVKN